MSNILIGYLFTCINITLNINGHELDCLPDFVGYFLIYYGCKSLQEKSKHFKTATYIALVMSIYHVPSYICRLMGTSFYSEGIVATLLTIVTTIVSLLLSRYIVDGIRDLEVLHAANLYGKTLYDRWVLIAITSSILCVISVSILFMANILAFIAGGVILVNVIFQLMFLYTLYKSNNQCKTLGIA